VHWSPAVVTRVPTAPFTCSFQRRAALRSGPLVFLHFSRPHFAAGRFHAVLNRGRKMDNNGAIARIRAEIEQTNVPEAQAYTSGFC